MVAPLTVVPANVEAYNTNENQGADQGAPDQSEVNNDEDFEGGVYDIEEDDEANEDAENDVEEEDETN